MTAIPLERCRQFDLPMLDRPYVPKRRTLEERADARVQAWREAPQAILGDARPLQPDRIWIHPDELGELDGCASKPLARIGKHRRSRCPMYNWAFEPPPWVQAS